MTPTQADREKAKSVYNSAWNGVNWKPNDVIEKFSQALADQREESAQIIESDACIGMSRSELAAAIRKGKL